MKILTTLAESDYFLGAAALINSVVFHGTYIDKIIIGYRGELPKWLPELRSSVNGLGFTTKAGLVIELVEISGQLHMVHEKPRWFEYVTKQLAPEAEEYFFFDSDITLCNRMNFFGEWAQEGIGVCGDINFIFDHRHPIRRKWARVAETAGLEITNELNGFYNSGFLAWRKEDRQFIDDWTHAFDLLSPYSGDMKQFRVHTRTDMVQSANQDSLNLAMMTTKRPIAPVGPEAMSFVYGMNLMHHPVGPKPWKRSYLLDFFRGKLPRVADVEFWHFLNGSALQPVSNSKAMYYHKLCRLLRFLGRFYHGLK